MSSEAPEPLVEVRLLGLPVAIWAQANEHTSELLREFALIAGSDGAGHEPPARLTALVTELTSQYAGFTAEQEAQLIDAAAGGIPEVDLSFRVPASAGPAAVHLGDVLDEADRYCQAGRHLLTLATPPAALAFRQWYLSQFTDQLAGRPPTSWTAWMAARSG